MKISPPSHRRPLHVRPRRCVSICGVISNIARSSGAEALGLISLAWLVGNMIYGSADQEIFVPHYQGPSPQRRRVLCVVLFRRVNFGGGDE